jgi:hypothetical protein
MASISHHPHVATPQAVPAAVLVLPTQRLLTEKSSVTVELGSCVATMENLALRATKITVILKEIPGYRPLRTR